MGGCRCSYRDCTARSDGKIHMFHFPVFDKLRCHQWIINAQKPNFFNLKLSQLRNRVVCQHHFQDNNFMNYMKDKLIFNAVPTEDGPLCQSTVSQQTIKEDVEDAIPINADDIENDGMIMPTSKKAHFSVKYSDFLTTDVTDIFGEIPDITSNTSLTDDNHYKLEFNIEKQNELSKANMNSDVDLKTQTNSITDVTLNNSDPTLLSLEFDDTSLQKKSNITKYTKQKDEKIKVHKHKKPISIISEKKIYEPVKIKGKLHPISPSFVIQMPKAKKNPVKTQSVEEVKTNEMIENQSSTAQYQTNVNTNNENIYNNIQPLNLFETDSNMNNINNEMSQANMLYNQNLNPTDKIDFNNETQYNNQDVQQLKTNEIQMEVDNFSIKKQNEGKKILQPSKRAQKENYVKKLFKSPECAPSSKSLLKNKLPPEKLAAIEEKRKFNMKIRDIINSCLNKLDDKETKCEDNDNMNRSDLLQSSFSNQSEHLTTLACLEARLQKMENSLINKIDQNTQRILEIKRTLKPSANKKVAVTQTYMSEEVNKRQLYQEISKYLTPNTNSLIYEELFINNKFNKNETDKPRKRRRR